MNRTEELEVSRRDTGEMRAGGFIPPVLLSQRQGAAVG